MEPSPCSGSIEFDESLQPHDKSVSPVLRFIQQQVAAGVRDEHWLEEQCQFLLGRLIAAHRKWRNTLPSSSPTPGLRSAPNSRGVSRGQPTSCTRTLQMRSLSRTSRRRHTCRVFISCGCFGWCTAARPGPRLRDLRTRRAQALMESTTLTADEIAGRVGMSRIALWRSLRAKGSGVRRAAPRGRFGANRVSRPSA